MAAVSTEEDADTTAEPKRKLRKKTSGC